MIDYFIMYKMTGKKWTNELDISVNKFAGNVKCFV